MFKDKTIKNMLSSLKQKQLIQFFQLFLTQTQLKLYKSIKQISFSCYESTCQVENVMVNGYGKTSIQALLSGINNILDTFLEDKEYKQIMIHCLKKINTYINTQKCLNMDLANNHPQINSESKKHLIKSSIQKSIKTLHTQQGQNQPQSLSQSSTQKKQLTMSANLSSASKQSKSIKDQIFEYFNLQNLKVKNPKNINLIQSSTSTINPIGLVNNNLIRQNSKSTLTNSFQSNLHMQHSKSKQKYSVKQKYYQNKHEKNNHQIQEKDYQLENVYKKIKQIQGKIRKAEYENQMLKQELGSKLGNKKGSVNDRGYSYNVNQVNQKNQQNHVNHVNQVNQPNQPNQCSQANYFTRPSIEPKCHTTNQGPTTQSSKKLSYLQMSTQPNVQKKIQYETKQRNYLVDNQQNQFDKIDILQTKVKENSSKPDNREYTGHSYPNKYQRKSLLQSSSSSSKHNASNTYKNLNNLYQQQPQKRCLLDISNLAHNTTHNKESKSEFNTIVNHNNTTNTNGFMTTTNAPNDMKNMQNAQNSSSSHLLLASKACNNNYQNNVHKNNNYPQRQQLSTNQSCEKKLRSFSLNSNLTQKLSAFSTLVNTNTQINNTKQKQCPTNPYLNSSFENQNRKIKIPKLNLQILPNYHGKSNKSLNQSLMDNYEKKNNTLKTTKQICQ